MSKPIATVIFIAILFIGMIFIVLDVLDIAEDYRIEWPIATINTVLISVMAIPIVYYSTRSFQSSGSSITLGLGGAVLAFGFSILLYGWLSNTDLDTRITTYDSGVFIAAVMHTFGAGYVFFKRENLLGNTTSRISVVIIIYIGILLVISIITWLAHKDIITFILTPLPANLVARDIVQGAAFILCIGSALIYLKHYFKARADSSFWYCLGLVLFATGVIFISRGPLESRIAWLGRASQYTGSIYMLMAAFSIYRQIIQGNKKQHQS